MSTPDYTLVTNAMPRPVGLGAGFPNIPAGRSLAIATAKLQRVLDAGSAAARPFEAGRGLLLPRDAQARGKTPTVIVRNFGRSPSPLCAGKLPAGATCELPLVTFEALSRAEKRWLQVVEDQVSEQAEGESESESESESEEASPAA